ncbi:MAG: bifunctional oligoribonuclease/PAP phosphatase NrnA [Deltaproteobacteria bacterium]|nr:bifunctional oligoribonuclease/PAP phosphatase NrnA [Candidatus Zymogenaceae bacterium]
MRADISGVIERAQRIFLTTHLNPDGDAVGSLLACSLYLRERNSSVTVYMQDPVPKNFRFLPGVDMVVHDLAPLKGSRYDVSLVLDSTDWERVGGRPGSDIDLGTIINIDHHVSNRGFGDLNLVDPGASATAEIIFDILSGMGGPVSKDIATCIYSGIMSDTGCFTYSNTNTRAFEISRILVERGVRPDMVAEQIHESYPIARLEMLREALSTLEFSNDMAIGVMTISQEMFQKTHSGPDIIEGFIDYPRFVAGVKVAVLFRELPEGGYKVSFRSRSNLDVSRVAAQFGGGGHTNASGCTVHMPLDQAKERVFDVVRGAVMDSIGEGVANA